jgi:hypothetical protein
MNLFLSRHSCLKKHKILKYIKKIRGGCAEKTPKKVKKPLKSDVYLKILLFL